MALEWVVLGYAAAAEAIMVLLLTIPGLDGLRRGLIAGDAQSAEAVLVGGAVLSVLAHGHLLEVRDAPQVRGRLLHADGALAPSEIHHEEPAQRAPDRLGFGFLLVALLGHQSRCQDRAVESEGREAQEQGLIHSSVGD
ncbi:hypothetical protein Dsin_008957 [Dipteronia sinensis]|uniref:Uncharacterized protein n=1 Tax=Dipteronia sinensis TaxID=43782 RepID=A0AAE0EBM5_9ROSI|nr:hypothetical protein Dsin_008957 [Dipteronia sinensis]